jgi:hypothetical protein
MCKTAGSDLHNIHRTRALCLHRLPLPLPSRDHLPPCSLAHGVRLTWHLAATISDEETVRRRCAGATVASACAGGWCSMCLAPHSSPYKVILWFFVPLFVRPPYRPNLYSVESAEGGPGNRPQRGARWFAFGACLGISGMKGYWGGGISIISQNFPKSPSIFFHPLDSSISQISPQGCTTRLWCLRNCSLSRKFLGSKKKNQPSGFVPLDLYLHYLKFLNLSNNSTSCVRTTWMWKLSNLRSFIQYDGN